MFTFLVPGIIVILAVLVISVLANGYIKAPPDRAFIVSGYRKDPKILIGRAGIKIPFLERKDTLLLKQISIDIKTNGYVPTLDFIGVDIDAVAKVRIKSDDDGIKLAMKNFLNMEEPEIIRALTDSLQGNMREIIGTVLLRELNTDRKKFGDEVQMKAQTDMNALGIEIISCNIQKIEDERGLINALGQDNMSQIQKDASVAKALAERDIAIAEAEADKFARLQVADADLYERQKKAEAELFERTKNAEARKAEADATIYAKKQEAEGIQAVGEAEAKAIEAKGIAEAQALEKKADAMAKYGKAAMMELIVKALPDMAHAIAEPLSTIDKVTIIDSGNGETGVGTMGSYVPQVLAKTIESVKEVTGFDLTEVMKADTYEASVNKNITVAGIPDVVKIDTPTSKINTDHPNEEDVVSSAE